MNGRASGPLPELDLDGLIVTRTVNKTILDDSTYGPGSIAKKATLETELTVPKMTGYRLVGIGGYILGLNSNSNSSYLVLIRKDIVIGEESDALRIGIKNSNSDSTANYELQFELIYIKES